MQESFACKDCSMEGNAAGQLRFLLMRVKQGEHFFRVLLISLAPKLVLLVRK